MSTRTRIPRTEEERIDPFERDPFLGLEDDVTDEDIEDFLARTEETEQKSGFLNLPTMAGLATIGVGAAYLLEQMGLFTTQFQIGSILGPWLIGVVIILIGFGFLSWKPKRKQSVAARRRASERRETRQRRQRAPMDAGSATSAREESTTSRTVSGRKQFAKSRTNKKLAGVCGGIGEYFGIDPTIVRIAFVIALIAGQGMAIPVYLILAFVMPKPEPPRLSRSGPSDTIDDERVVIIRS